MGASCTGRLTAIVWAAYRCGVSGNPISDRVFDRKCGKTALEFILPADAATIPPISGALPDASATVRPPEANFPHLRPGGGVWQPNLLSIPPAALQTNLLSSRVFGRKCNKSVLVLDRKCSIPPGLRPQMQQIGPGVHSARRRGNDSAHFGRFAGRVCNRCRKKTERTAVYQKKPERKMSSLLSFFRPGKSRM